MRVLRIGLTGGIGSGKSTVSAMICALGAGLVDADAISRSLTAANGDAIPAIRQLFGSSFITPEQALDRPKMRDYVFRDAARRKCLEGIIHPLVGREIARIEAQAHISDLKALVFDVPLLVESEHWRNRVDTVVVVDCEPDTQVQRVVGRSGLKPDTVREIMAQQVNRSQRLAAADAVIANGVATDFASLKTQVGHLMAHFGLSSSAVLPSTLA